MDDFETSAAGEERTVASGGRTAPERTEESRVSEAAGLGGAETGAPAEEAGQEKSTEPRAACGLPAPPPMTPAIAAQMREIAALDPAIRGPEDLLGMECYPRFYELVRRGNSFVDAYRLANFDTLAARAAEIGRQAARAAAASKQHLLRTQTRGADAVSVPAEIREGYRAMNPGISDVEIARHYGRYISSLRG